MIKFFKKLFFKKSVIIKDEFGNRIFNVVNSESSVLGCVLYKSKVGSWHTIIILYAGGKTNYSDISWYPHKGFK